MLKGFWNLAYAGLKLVETKQNFGTKVDELDNTGHNANDGEGLSHSVSAVVGKSATDGSLCKQKGLVEKHQDCEVIMELS